jgi:mediator of RNA polymerase II transcription subunit 21
MAEQPSSPKAPTTATTDSLTQLQDCFDQLLIRMFASIRYIDSHHPYGIIEGQSDQSLATTQSTQPQTQSTQTQQTQLTNTQTQTQTETASSHPAQPQSGEGEVRDSPEKFESVLQELAQDLIIKEQQIEYLVDSLPGLGNSQASQEARIRELEKELREVEVERKSWVSVQEELVGRVEGKIKGIRRV